jgi:hypothetical protein
MYIYISHSFEKHLKYVEMLTGRHTVGFEVLTLVDMRNPALLVCCLLRAGSLLGLFFDHEHRGKMFLRNVD